MSRRAQMRKYVKRQNQHAGLQVSHAFNGYESVAFELVHDSALVLATAQTSIARLWGRVVVTAINATAGASCDLAAGLQNAHQLASPGLVLDPQSPAGGTADQRWLWKEFWPVMAADGAARWLGSTGSEDYQLTFPFDWKVHGGRGASIKSDEVCTIVLTLQENAAASSFPFSTLRVDVSLFCIFV